jgi:hypothetical protein
LSEVTAIFEEAIMRADDDIRDINWDDIEYEVEIGWDKRVCVNNVDASDQVGDVLNSVNDCFEKLLTDYVELRKENNS